MVQTKAFAIILSKNYTSYESALLSLNLERLDTRRTNLSYSFVAKCAKSNKHKSMFPPNPNYRPNIRNPKSYREHLCNTSRYFNSPFLYIS
jgi:hypothetical protein